MLINKKDNYTEKPNFDSALKLIIDNNLYKTGIDLFYNDKEKDIILQYYGDYLYDNKQIIESVHIYCSIKEKTNELNNKIYNYSQECGLWNIMLQMVCYYLIQAKILKIDKSDLSVVISNMIETISKSGDSSDIIIASHLLVYIL